MAAEVSTRLAQLPGYDTAPDVYETPELDDSTTTDTAQTSPRAASVPSETSSEEEEDDAAGQEGYGVSRRRLHPERARTRFVGQSRGVKTRGADLSDRVDGRRKGYRVRRGYEVEEQEEGLEARIARLKREVEECKALAKAEAGKGVAGEDGEEEDGDEGDSKDGRKGIEAVDALSRLLAGIELPAQGKTPKPEADNFHDALPTAVPPDGTQPTSSAIAGPSDDNDDHLLLPRISAFDARLAALETALGVLDTHQTSEAPPLLPSLTLLDERLAALTSATSLAALEAASSRIAKLRADAQDLSQSQSQHAPNGTTQSDVDEDHSPSPHAPTAPQPLSSTSLSTLQILTTLLPTLQSLAPTLPLLLTRLRSLRTLHSSAASAGSDLSALEQRQSETERELKMWREGLEKVEAAVKEADTANGRNGGVREWVG